MSKKVENQKDIRRYNPEFNIGLSDLEIKERQENGLVNKTDVVVGKSTWEIIRTDVLSLFNITLFTLAIFIIVGNVYSGQSWFTGIFFTGIVIFNMILSLYQDFKAKYLMKKMKLLTTPNARVIRGGKESLINPQEIVLDDVLLLKSGDQIASDSIILNGEVSVNESLLTGESVDVIKRAGDTLLSGTFITSGTCYSRVDKIGKDNYAETISTKAKAFKRNPSHILKSLKKLFRFLGILIAALFVIISTTYAIQGSFSTFKGFINVISPLCAQFVLMIPAGLYLLTSVTLATGVVSLYRKHANVQDFYSIEMLARANVLCVDKTGTITDGTMNVSSIIPISKVNEDEVKKVISDILGATKDNNLTAEALKNYCGVNDDVKCLKCLPFNSANKYSGVTLSTGVTYLLGAIEYLNLKDKTALTKQSEEYTSKGYRVLIVGKSTTAIKGDKFDSLVTPVAMIVIQDHIKANAKETFAWFKENNVEIKVISGDNALTVSQIALEAGIENAHKYVSLEGMSIDDVMKIANDYTVFGRVTPEQKEALVKALKNNGKTVAMTGDGANDMLALKRADCSIAMNSGAAAAKNVSHIVLLNNDFSTMPEIVGEGRRVINNVQRTGSLFLTKTFFAIVISVVFWIVSICTANKYGYPFSTSNLMVWEIFGFGLPSFFISLERNPSSIKDGFLRNILTKAIPSAILLLVGVLTCYVCFILQKNGLVYTGVSEFGYDSLNSRMPVSGATALSVLVFTTLSLVVLFNTCRPFSKYRMVVMIGAVVCSALCFAIDPFMPRGMFKINYSSITNPNLMLWAAIVLVLGAIGVYLTPITDFVVKYIKILVKKVKKNEN